MEENIDDFIKELNDLTKWAVIACTIDKDGLLDRINEIRNKINKGR